MLSHNESTKSFNSVLCSNRACFNIYYHYKNGLESVKTIFRNAHSQNGKLGNFKTDYG